MKIIVVSDSHGNVDELSRIVLMNGSADIVVFCGDGYRDIQSVRGMYPDKMYVAVKGNNDWYCNEPYLQEIKVCGKKIIITHGHTYGVKEGYYRIASYAHSVNADIALFGHTHSQYLDYDGRVLLMNPGSIGYKGEHGIIEIEDSGKITAKIYPANQFNPPITIQ